MSPKKTARSVSFSISMAMAFSIASLAGVASAQEKPAAPPPAPAAPAATPQTGAPADGVRDPQRHDAPPADLAGAAAALDAMAQAAPIATGSGGPVDATGRGLAHVQGDGASKADATAGRARTFTPGASAATDGARKPAATPRQLRRMNAQLVIASLGAPFRTCYEKGARDPHVAANVVVRLGAKPTGEVETAEIVSGPTLPADVASCIVQAARGVKFAAPGGAGVSVNVPASLAAEKKAAAGDASLATN